VGRKQPIFYFNIFGIALPTDKNVSSPKKIFLKIILTKPRCPIIVTNCKKMIGLY